MRFRLIGVLAALLMLAPAAGFARTSTLTRQDQTTQTATAKKKKAKVRKASTKKTSKKMSKKKSTKKGKSSAAPGSN
jgi:hypothetical protein